MTFYILLLHSAVWDVLILQAFISKNEIIEYQKLVSCKGSGWMQKAPRVPA